MVGLILYFQEECHLCDEAELLLRSIGLADSYREVDIESDLELLKEYGIHVPVLQREDTKQRLFWPFDEATIKDFLGSGQ